jgi:hypothetical protein
MTLPFTLPDWVPWWVPIVLLVPALLYALLLLAMPFNVFGVKARLEAVEARLDEIQHEIRSLALRLPEPLRGVPFDETGYAEPPPQPRNRMSAVSARPPIPPAPATDPDGPPDSFYADRGGSPRLGPLRSGRNEPRLDRR